MTTSLKTVLVAALAAALVAGGCRRGESRAAGGRSSASSKAADDNPTSSRKDLYLDHYRFGNVTDADGVVVRETSVIPPSSTAAMSFYVRNVPDGTQVRIVWNDLANNQSLGEEVKPVGEKGFVTFKQAKPSPQGSYRVTMYSKQPKSTGWTNLGTHDFIVGSKS